MYLPWDSSWSDLVTYVPWRQPELTWMEQSPVLPAYPIFATMLNSSLSPLEFYSSVAGAMVFLMGHDPEAAINGIYGQWLRMYNKDLAVQAFYEGTEMMGLYQFPHAVWLFQASLLLAPYSYETNYNLSLAFHQLGMTLAGEGRLKEAEDCYRQARQYRENAAQLEEDSSPPILPPEMPTQGIYPPL